MLANICRKPLEQIFAQFAALEVADEVRMVLLLLCHNCTLATRGEMTDVAGPGRCKNHVVLAHSP